MGLKLSCMRLCGWEISREIDRVNYFGHFTPHGAKSREAVMGYFSPIRSALFCPSSSEALLCFNIVGVLDQDSSLSQQGSWGQKV